MDYRGLPAARDIAGLLQGTLPATELGKGNSLVGQKGSTCRVSKPIKSSFIRSSPRSCNSNRAERASGNHETEFANTRRLQ